MGNKLEILQLLENGSITAEEAERLLDTAEHEELEAFRQEMREQMAAIQNAAEDARCAAADARCAADEAEEYAANAEDFANAAEEYRDDDDDDDEDDEDDEDDGTSGMNAMQWEAFTGAMQEAEEAMGMVQSILESLGVQGVNVREKFREGMRQAQSATGRNASAKRGRNGNGDSRGNAPCNCTRINDQRVTLIQDTAERQAWFSRRVNDRQRREADRKRREQDRKSREADRQRRELKRQGDAEYTRSLRNFGEGDIVRPIRGTLTECVQGDILGPVYGDINSTVEGDLLTREVHGNLHGTIGGDVRTTLLGYLDGTVEGDFRGVLDSDL